MQNCCIYYIQLNRATVILQLQSQMSGPGYIIMFSSLTQLAPNWEWPMLAPQVCLGTVWKSTGRLDHNSCELFS